MSERLCLATMKRIPPSIRIPRYDFANTKTGILHIGLGAFARAHQAVFTEDSIELSGGNWGIAGVSLKSAGTVDAVRAQDGLYTIEFLDNPFSYRVIGAVREALYAPRDFTRVLALFGSRDISVSTLTVTEKGYCLGAFGGLDFDHPDIKADLERPELPVSAIGFLCHCLKARRDTDAGPITVMSCDNLPANSAKLEQATLLFAERTEPGLSAWIQKNVCFPETMVDCMVPATSSQARARVSTQLGLQDDVPVEREGYAQWVIARRFAGPVPDWQAAGVEIVDDVKGYERLKLHVLNLVHSALAYFGLQRGHTYVRQAIRDEDISRYAEALVAEEIAPALSPLPVMEYWKKTLARLRNPDLDHQLSKIAEDGSLKLALRAFPLLEYNYNHQLPLQRLAGIVRAWMSFVAKGPVRDPYSAELSAWAHAGADRSELLKHPLIFPDVFRSEARLRAAVTGTDLLIPALRDTPC